MTASLRTPTPHAYSPTPAPKFVPVIRPALPREYNWVITSWVESYKAAPGMPDRWADYKAVHAPRLRECLAREDTQVLVAADPVSDRGAGWIAFARWPRIDAVHWLYVAPQHRGHRYHLALLAGAALRDHVVYTHKASIRKRKTRADLWLAEVLLAQGKAVSYYSYKEWRK